MSAMVYCTSRSIVSAVTVRAILVETLCAGWRNNSCRERPLLTNEKRSHGREKHGARGDEKCNRRVVLCTPCEESLQLRLVLRSVELVEDAS